MLDNTFLTAIAQTGNPVSIITGIKYNANVVKAFNSLTFLFDPNWVYSKEEPNYPLAFFYVKTMTEVSESEVSQNPLLFYNAEVSGTDASKAGLMNIVADNIITKPKTYKINVIIPMDATAMFSGAYWDAETIARVEKFIVSKNGDEENAFSALFSFARTSIGIFKTLIKALYGTTLSANAILTMLTSQQDYNKTSIDAMWRSRRFVRLKMWTGWKFKDLIIQNFECNKSGEDGDYFEGTIICQEVPILTFRNSKELKFNSVSKTFSATVGKAILTTATSFIKAMEATKES